jgi:hypothetical protein
VVPGGKAPGGRRGSDRPIGEQKAYLLDLHSKAPRPVAQPKWGRTRKYRNRLPSRLYGGQMGRLVDPQGEP